MTYSSSPYTLYNADRYRRDTPPAEAEADTGLSPNSQEVSSGQASEPVLSASLSDTPVESIQRDLSQDNTSSDNTNPIDSPVNLEKLEKKELNQYRVVDMTGDILPESSEASALSAGGNFAEKKQEALMSAVPLVSAAEPTAPKTPGSHLKQLREQKRLSAEHIADKLCLHQGVILALEADNYEILPPSVFVRGYLRAYANLLDTPSEPVLALYEQQHQDVAPPPLTLHNNKRVPQASSTDPWFKVGTFILFISIMVLMTLWKFYPDFQQRNSEPTTAVPLTSEPMDRRLPGEDLGMAAQPLIGIQPIPLSANSSRESGILVYTPPAEEEGNTEVSESPVVVVDSATSPPEAQIPVSQELKIKVTREAWMQITDKEGKQLFLGTAAAGRSLTLEGTPPYQIRVGNLDGVTVEYQGTNQPLSAYPRGEGGRRMYVIGQASE